MLGCFEALVVGYEKSRLSEKYGDQYDAYRNDVPRWVTLANASIDG